MRVAVGQLFRAQIASWRYLDHALAMLENGLRPQHDSRVLRLAAATVVIAPVLVLFFFAQRYFIEGIALTGTKG